MRASSQARSASHTVNHGRYLLLEWPAARPIPRAPPMPFDAEGRPPSPPDHTPTGTYHLSGKARVRRSAPSGGCRLAVSPTSGSPGRRHPTIGFDGQRSCDSDDPRDRFDTSSPRWGLATLPGPPGGSGGNLGFRTWGLRYCGGPPPPLPFCGGVPKPGGGGPVNFLFRWIGWPPPVLGDPPWKRGPPAPSPPPKKPSF